MDTKAYITLSATAQLQGPRYHAHWGRISNLTTSHSLCFGWSRHELCIETCTMSGKADCAVKVLMSWTQGCF